MRAITLAALMLAGCNSPQAASTDTYSDLRAYLERRTAQPCERQLTQEVLEWLDEQRRVH